MRLIVPFLMLTSGAPIWAQCLSFQFDELGFESAHCRTSFVQNGHAVVYASVIGGMQPYSYLWTNLQTGQTTENSVWGGLNAGSYEIYAHDSSGCFLRDTLVVDSVLVTSGFQIVSDDYDSTGALAFLPFIGRINLTVPPCIYAQPAYPDPDTNFMWKIDPGIDWTVGRCWEDLATFSLSNPGDYLVSVVVLNENGCADTATQLLTAVLPLYSTTFPVVYADFATGQIFAEIPMESPVVFELYNLAGTLTAEIVLSPGANSFHVGEGISFYKIRSADSQHELARGKLFIAVP